MDEELKNRGWHELTFLDIAKSLKRGPFGGNLKKAFFVPSGYKVYEQQHAINKDFQLGTYFIDDEKYEELKGFAVGSGDYIISCSGTIGKLYRLPKDAPDGVINQALLKITLEDGLLTHSYFSYLFQSEYFQRQILSDARGTGMQNLAGMKEIKVVPVFIPPFPEQRKIVEKLDELISELDNGIANLKAAKDKLEIYRQAVLKKAFEGELTKEWRENKIVKRNSWNYFKFGEILKTIDGDRGKNYPKKHELLESGFCLFLSTKNVRQGEFVFEENLFITEEKDKILRGGKMQRNDVVITTRGTLGNVAHFDSKVHYHHIRINSGMLILRVNDTSQISPKFLMRFINSALFFIQLKAKQSGTAQPQIPANILREIEIEVPSTIDEQEEILYEIESRLSVCDNILANIEEGLEKSEALRQSILKQAFEGKLLSEEELEACKQEPDWEPAEQLLERIKNEKLAEA